MNKFLDELDRHLLNGGEAPALLPDMEITEEVFIQNFKPLKSTLEFLSQRAQMDEGHTRETLYAYLTALEDVYQAETGERLHDPELLKTIKAQAVDLKELRTAPNAIKREDYPEVF